MQKNVILSAVVALSVLVTQPALAGTGHFYPESAVSGARANVKNFEWAKKEADEIQAYAQVWLDMSYDQIWNFLSEQSIPRAVFAGKPPRCPIHGSLEGYGDYAYSTVPEERWKVRCPVGGESWPTNDFEAYYKSGKDGNNKFDAGRANGGLLYSQDSSRGYGVDNGNGYVDGSGNRYHFVAYYAFWGIWSRVARSDYNAITVLTQSYLLTGNPEYARRAALFLARAADLYGEMDTSYWSARGVTANDGGTNMGKVLGNIWDDDVANNFMFAYDALAPFIEKDKETQKLLGAYAKKFGLSPQSSGQQIKAHIEKNLLANIVTAVKNRQIRSNEGRAQHTLALAALLQGGSAITDAMAWLNEPGDNYNGGGHLPQLFWSLIDRDGAGTEGSPYYNGVWLEALQPLAFVMSRMSTDEDLFVKYPRLRQLLHYPGRLMTLGKYFPHIGDSGSAGSPEAPLVDLAQRYAKAFLQFKDEESAIMAYKLNGNSAENLHAGLFGGDAKAIGAAIAKVVEARGNEWERSDNMNGYGLALHKAGAGSAARSMWLYWGRTGHGGNHPHSDRLNLGLFGYGMDLLPDLGYPEYAIAWPTTQGWMKNTSSHNTVVVDAKRQGQTYSGDQKVFADTPYVQMSEVDGGNVYPQTSMYKRSVAMIHIDNQDSYVVDLFRVQGGNEHVYSFHTAEGDATAEGLNLSFQGGGTYAGPGVSKGDFYDEGFSGTYSGSGFQFLDNVATDAAAGETFSVDWLLKDTWGVLPAEWAGNVHLRMTMVGNEGQVSLADGQPSQNRQNPKSLRYMLVKNTGGDSRFLGVIEPYLSNPKVKSVSLMPVTGATSKHVVALKVELTTGRTDYVFSSLDDESYTTEDGRFTFRGRYSVYAEKGGQMAFSFLADGGELSVDGTPVASAVTPEGKVLDVTQDAEGNTVVTVDSVVSDDGSLINQWIDFAPTTESDANFKVKQAANSGSAAVLTLEGDPYFGFQNPEDASSGLLSMVQPGIDYRVPAVTFERGPAYEELSTDAAFLAEPAPASAASKPKADASSGGMGCTTTGAGPQALWPLLAIPLAVWFRRRRLAVRS
jgi:hypothetical protein